MSSQPFTFTNAINAVVAASCIGIVGFMWSIRIELETVKHQMEKIEQNEDRIAFLHDEIIRLDYASHIEPGRTPKK